MGFSRQEYWSRLPFSPPGDLPDPGIEPESLMSPTLVGRFFTTSTIWEALVKKDNKKIKYVFKKNIFRTFLMKHGRGKKDMTTEGKCGIKNKVLFHCDTLKRLMLSA